MTIKVGIVVASGGKEKVVVWKGHRESFCFAVNVLFLDLGGDYTCVHVIGIKLYICVSCTIHIVISPKVI